MIVVAGVLAPLVLGAGIHAWARRWGPGVPWTVGVPLWGALGAAMCLGGAALGGVRWSAALPLAMAAAGLVLAAAGFRRTTFRRPTLLGVCAAGLAAAHAAVLGTSPAFGWDFRYIWGLKARVFAAAGGYDWGWLAWSGHSFAHPDYPPAWPGLLASAALLGGDPVWAAAAWQGALALALAAACWWAARGAAPAARLLAAAAGAWAPVIFAPVHSGYAEPLLALAAVVALAAVRDLARGDGGAIVPLGAGVALLALTKNEGIALAAGLVAGTALVAGRRVAVVAAGLVPAAAWKLAVAVHGVAGESLDLGPGRLGQRVLELPAAFVRWASTPELTVLVAACVLAAVGLRGRDGSRGVVAALAVWLGAVVVMYVAGTKDLSWWLETSLERVLAAPLPAVVALAVSRGSAAGAGGGRPAET